MPLEQSYINQILQTASKAARLAGNYAAEHIRTAKASVKNGQEIVTEADKACQQIIVDKINETFDGHGFVGEEGENGGVMVTPATSPDGIWWSIDPIDGTNNYSRGLINYCVIVGAMHNNKPIAGVIYEPATDSMFTAALNIPTQLNGEPITVSDDGIDKLNSVSVDSHFSDAQAPAIMELIRSTRFRNLGTTGMHLAYVAKGALIGSIVSKIKLWELAACSILVENAGGIVTNHQGNPIFPINPANYKGEGIELIAANKITHPVLVELMNR